MRRRGTLRARACAVGAVGVVAALVACGPTAPPAGDGPPAAFEDRARLGSCGEVTLDQGEEVPDDAWVCLEESRTTGAELVVTRPTTEGDGIVEYVRVGPDIDGVEVWVDVTADRFGGTDAGWTLQRCPGAATVRDRSTCVEA